MAAALIFAGSVGAGSATAQMSASSGSSFSANTGGYSLLDLTIFGGYEWFQFGQGTDNAVHGYHGSGVWGERLSEEFSRYIAAEEGIQIGYNRYAFRPYGASQLSSAPAGQTQLYAAGVVHLTPREAKYRPFLLIGPSYEWYKAPDLASATIAPGSPALIFPPNALKQQGRTALIYGVGVKINSSPRWGVRFDLTGTRSGTPHYGLPGVPYGAGSIYSPGGYLHESSLTASVGITFRFRYRELAVPAGPYVVPVKETPKPPVVISVGAITGARDVCSGDDIRLTVTASGWPSDATPSYQWMVNGSPAPGGTSSSFSVPTADGAGAKTVTVMVSAAGASGTSAPVTVNVRPLAPPTISFTISPSTVTYGTRVPLAATANGSSCGGPATVVYSGQGVTGSTFDSTALNFDMSNPREQRQTVTIRATATDQKRQTASSTADVTVVKAATARRLDDIIFPQLSSRVNNCAKRLLLEELTPMLRSDPGSKVILIGHRDASEKGRAAARLDEMRVINSAAVLSAGKGICPSLDLSRVMVNWVGDAQNDETRPALCGTSTNVKEKGGQGVKESDKRAPFRRVEIWFIPSGADIPATLTGLKPAPAKDIQAKGCPK
jgi:outer membrane protein OmpA-like peptidoglycan-associated protein